MGFLERLSDWLSEPIFQTKDWVLTPFSILKLIILPILLLIVTKLVRKALFGRLLRKGQVDVGAANAISTLTSYAFIAVGLYAIISDAGVDVTSLAVLGGALGIGIGFGLQQTARNFMSGLILLLGRNVRPGDRIQLGDLEGDVSAIGIYSTVVTTVGDAAIVVPNSQLLDNQLVNWTLTGERRRVSLSVDVHFDSDPQLVRSLLLGAATSDPDVESQPESEVRLNGFTESGMRFELFVWTTTMVDFPNRLRSNLNFAILESFKQHGVRISYPQRDVHLLPSAQ